jgi:hypothetical protein
MDWLVITGFGVVRSISRDDAPEYGKLHHLVASEVALDAGKSLLPEGLSVQVAPSCSCLGLCLNEVFPS